MTVIIHPVGYVRRGTTFESASDTVEIDWKRREQR